MQARRDLSLMMFSHKLSLSIYENSRMYHFPKRGKPLLLRPLKRTFALAEFISIPYRAFSLPPLGVMVRACSRIRKLPKPFISSFDVLALGSLVLLSNDIARTSQALHPDRLPLPGLFFPTSRVREARLTSWSRLFYYNYSIKDGGVRLSPLGNLQCLAYVYRCRHPWLFRRYGHLCSN